MVVGESRAGNRTLRGLEGQSDLHCFAKRLRVMQADLHAHFGAEATLKSVLLLLVGDVRDEQAGLAENGDKLGDSGHLAQTAKLVSGRTLVIAVRKLPTQRFSKGVPRIRSVQDIRRLRWGAVAIVQRTPKGERDAFQLGRRKRHTGVRGHFGSARVKDGAGVEQPIVQLLTSRRRERWQLIAPEISMSCEVDVE